MDNLIPKNTPENTVSGWSGRIMMVKLGRKAIKMGVVCWNWGVIAVLTGKGLVLPGWGLRGQVIA